MLSERARMIVFFTLLGFYLVIVVVSLGTYLLRVLMTRDRILSRRPVTLVALQASGCLILGLWSLASSAISEFPCFVHLWLVTLGLSFATFSFAIRAIHLIINAKVHDLKSKLAALGGVNLGKISAPKKRSLPLPESVLNESIDGSVVSSGMSQNLLENTFIGSSAHFPVKNPRTAKKRSDSISTTESMSISNTNLTFTNPICDRLGRKRLYRMLVNYSRLLHLATNRTMAITVCALAAVMAIFAIIVNSTSSNFSLSPPNTQCKAEWGSVSILIVFGVLLLVAFPAMFLLVWRLEDTFGIRVDLAACIGAASLNTAVAIGWSLGPPSIQEEFPGQIITWLSVATVHFSSVIWPLFCSYRLEKRLNKDARLSQDYYVLNQESEPKVALSERQREFYAVLENEVEYEQFRKYAAACFCSELTAFIDEFQILKYCTIRALEQSTIRGTVVDECGGDLTTIKTQVSSPIELLPALRRRPDTYRIYDQMMEKPQSRPLRINTHATAGILETARAAFPQYNFADVTFLPEGIAYGFHSFISTYIHPESYMAINISGNIVDPILDALHHHEVHLGILDCAKDEVLKLLYTDVYMRYCVKYQVKEIPSTQNLQK